MLFLVISFFTYIIEALIAYIFFAKITVKKFSFTKCMLIGIMIFMIGFSANYIFSNSIVINTIFFISINLLFAKICFNIKTIEAFFYSIILYIFSTTFEFSTIFIISSLAGVPIKAYNNDPILYIFIITISKAFYFITCLILSSFITKRNKNKFKFPLSLYIYPVSTTISLLIFWYISNQKDLTLQNRKLLAITSVILLFETVMIFLFYQNNIKKENEYVLLKSEFNRLKAEKNYYDILEQQNKKLRIYAHDTKNHLSAIKHLNSNPQIDEYIEKMISSLSVYSNTSKSGNVILDAIINRYVTECNLKNIKFAFNVALNNLLFVDDFDLVTILSNLLDNALEAAEKSTNKKISLETANYNSYGIIIITNSCNQKPISNNKKLLTTKKDKDIHGIGLKSVKQTLKNYEGDINWEYIEDSNEFITIVMLYNKKKNTV